MWRLAVRSARRSPGVTLACALTLALGAGATTSALALLNGVVLKPLAVERPRELVLFSDDTRDGVVFTGTPQGTLILFSTPSFEYLRAHQQSFTGVAAFPFGRDRVASRVDGAAELAAVTRVSANYFSVLGVRAQAGRLFDASDDRGGGLPAVVMSDACWLRRFQRDPAVVGGRITLGTASYTIAGVAARSFGGESMREPPDFWIPVTPGTAAPSAAYDEHHTWWRGIDRRRDCRRRHDESRRLSALRGEPRGLESCSPRPARRSSSRRSRQASSPPRRRAASTPSRRCERNSRRTPYFWCGLGNRMWPKSAASAI